MVSEISPGWMARLVCVTHLTPWTSRLSYLCLAAMSDFAKKQDEWYSTWPQDTEERAFVM